MTGLCRFVGQGPVFIFRRMRKSRRRKGFPYTIKDMKIYGEIYEKVVWEEKIK